MKAQLWSYDKERIIDVRDVVIDDDYDGDPYGDKVHFAVGSNQRIITEEYMFKDPFDFCL